MISFLSIMLQIIPYNDRELGIGFTLSIMGYNLYYQKASKTLKTVNDSQTCSYKSKLLKLS